MAKLTLDVVMNAVERDDMIGLCVACGAETRPVEPDARHYLCESCGKHEVFGAEELLLYMA